jgi:hypothetical protein
MTKPRLPRLTVHLVLTSALVWVLPVSAAELDVGARYPLTCANAYARGPSGMAPDLRRADGKVLVIEAAPTRTPTPIRTSAVSMEISYAASAPGEQVEVAVVLHGHGHEVAGVQNDIIFDPAVVDLEKPSSCKINPAIGDRLAECDEDPSAAACKSLQHNLAECPAAAGCPDGSEGLKRFRGIVLSISNLNTIPDGELYRCRFSVAADADLTLGAPLLCVNAGASDPDGNALTTSCRDGDILAPGGTPQPTRTPTSRPPTVTPWPTHTRGPTRTPTQARTPTATWDPRLPTWTPAPTTTARAPGSVTTIYMETDKPAVSAGLGGTVTVRAFAFDENNQPLNGVNLLFDFAPKVGTLRPISTTTRSKELVPGGCAPTEMIPGSCENPQPDTCRQPSGETCEAGVAEVEIEIEPGTASPGIVRVTALAAGSAGEVEFLVVSGESTHPVAAVVLRTSTAICGSDSGGLVGLQAFVFDADWNPVNDMNVLFLSPIGEVIPLTAKTTDEFGVPGGEARSTINLWPGTPILHDDNGNIVPYLITARAGGVEGVAQLFIVPGRVCEGYESSGYVGEPAFVQLAVSPTTLGVRGLGLPDVAKVTATVFDNSGNQLHDREIRFSLGAGSAWGAALSLRHCSGTLDLRCEINEDCLGTGSCIEESGSRVNTLTDRAGKASVRLLAGPLPGVVTINAEVPSLLGDEFTEPCAHAAIDSQRCVAANAVSVWVYAPAPPIPTAGHIDDDGCQIAPAPASDTAWRLLIPALLLLSRRKSGGRCVSCRRRQP